MSNNWEKSVEHLTECTKVLSQAIKTANRPEAKHTPCALETLTSARELVNEAAAYESIEYGKAMADAAAERVRLAQATLDLGDAPMDDIDAPEMS